jgi:hypothetical protein
MSSQTFTLAVSQFVEKAKAAPALVVRKATIDLFSAVVMRTPVGNPTLWAGPAPKGYVGGRLRANWIVSLGRPDASTTAAIDKTGDATKAKGITVITHADGEQDIWMTNNLPYALPIEYGHSGVQAPAGMVRVSVAEFSQYVDNAARELSK